MKFTPAVPSAVTGEKDAVDSDGKINPQMVRCLVTYKKQSKIETLESKVATLDGISWNK